MNEKADILNEAVWVLPAWRAAHTVQVGWSTPGRAQGQAGWGPAQTELVGGIPAQGRGDGTDEHNGPLQPQPFYDSRISEKKSKARGYLK